LRARCSELLTDARGLERLGDLAGRESEDLAQNEHRALARGQVLERGDERQLDALALLVGDVCVRIGLDPDRLE
jgi:hypothetical protein